MVVEQLIERRHGAEAVGGLIRAARWWRDSVAEPVLSVLFPPRCVGCGDFETHLCASCRDGLAAIGADSCPRCGEPGPQPLVGGRCSHCMGAESSCAGVRSAYRHQGVARRLVAEFKFGGQPVLGRLMAELAGPAFMEYLSAIGPSERILVTWVPSHRSAGRQRGYNQAEVLARRLAEGPPFPPTADLLEKMAATRHQKDLGRADRQSNLRGAFKMRSHVRLGATDVVPNAGAVETRAGVASSGLDAVVLVDDVYTTGATAHEVSFVLAQGTGLSVYVFTFSRAVAGKAEGHD